MVLHGRSMRRFAMALHGGEQLGNGIASYSNGKAKKRGEMLSYEKAERGRTRYGMATAL